MHVTIRSLAIPCAALVSLGLHAAIDAASRHQSPMFSEGEAYERFMGRWSARLAPLLVTWAGVRDGEQILDVGSGSGMLAVAAHAAAPAGRIVGIDPAANYVAFANARHGRKNLAFEAGDGQKMRFADATFDRTLSLLVLNFIPDRAKALAEMTRVTKPGGSVAAAVWDYGDGMQMLRVFWDEAIALKPDMAKRDERNMPLCRKGELAAMWREHGLQDVSEESLTIETRFASFADYWEPFLVKQGPAGAYAASLSDEDRVQLRDRLRRRLLPKGGDGPIVLSARAWAVRGIVPRAGRE